MKSRALLLTTALVAIAACAHAGSRHSVGVNLGLAIPGGDLANVVGTGYVMGADYEYRINPQFGVGFDLTYFSLGGKSTSTTYLGSARTVKQEAPGGQAIVFGRYYFPMKSSHYSPYVALGLEKVRIGFKSTVTWRGGSVTSEDKQDQPGFGLGVGVTRPFNDQLTGGIELGLHDIATSGEATHLYTLAVSCRYNLKQK